MTALLGNIIDAQLNIENHVSSICNMKINVLALQIMSSNKRKILMEAFIESHLITVFKYGCFTPESAIIRLPLSKKEH